MAVAVALDIAVAVCVAFWPAAHSHCQPRPMSASNANTTKKQNRRRPRRGFDLARVATTTGNAKGTVGLDAETRTGEVGGTARATLSGVAITGASGAGSGMANMGGGVINAMSCSVISLGRGAMTGGGASAAAEASAAANSL